MINARYSEILTELRVGQGLEKLASCPDDELALHATLQQAELCDSLFCKVQKLASESPISADLPRKEAMVAQMVRVVLDLRETHEATGEKFAAAPEVVIESLKKLATAVFVDGVLGEQLEKLAGTERDSTRAVQLLGREYAVHLMRNLLA